MIANGCEDCWTRSREKRKEEVLLGRDAMEKKTIGKSNSKG